MKHHPIFEKYSRIESEGTGRHVFDFLGVATDAIYKKGKEKFILGIGAKRTPNYPALNEHYFDWIAVLECVSAAKGTFRMAELGAGWAPWLVRARFAGQQVNDISNYELVGVEADPTHFNWSRSHFLDNDLNPDEYHLLNGAISSSDDMLKFPKINNPNEDYGASLRQVSQSASAECQYIEVQGYCLEKIFSLFSGQIDFLHLDVQGAEYDVLPNAMPLLKESVRAIMIGTHISMDHHKKLAELFESTNWTPVMIYPQNEKVKTEYGVVKFGDGFQFWKNTSI